ncbi:MAG: hypothetical protein DI586_08145 [Micavibrio aeruginosavorus]|uniref:Uncharacterized protein n=1 Tax=Micavibrio aeruginosavorus TaxID=349221 RepID=A0A2W5FGH6_9BACT|nr:MAG: hypothetical protein DI586_08145 [Micavibrio aeruginosavorus]
MIELISNRYSFTARLQPALLAILPVPVAIYLLVPELETRAATFVSILGYFGGSILLTHIGRNLGKSRESKLFREWGGKPSVTMLRHSDRRLNAISKARYHKFLAQNIPNFSLPDLNSENGNKVKADEAYSSASDWLVAKTRDKEKFPLVYEENINYGFRRNYWGLKWVALSCDCILLVIIIIPQMAISYNFFDWLFSFNNEQKIVLVVTIIHFALTLFITSAGWVKTMAESYAKQLISSCDSIS